VCLLLLLLAQPLAAADADAVYAEGARHLFNLDFDLAEAEFRSLTRDYPNNPDYWNALGTTYWLRILYNQQKLSMESFSGKDRFGTSDSKDSGGEAEEKQLRDTVDRAIALADAALKKNPKDLRALYAKGVSQATLASFEATIRRSWLSAAWKAKSAKNLHKDVLKLDPNFNDARAAVGIYNYAVGSLTRTARFMVFMVGLGGDGKEAGIRDLEIAAQKGTRASIDAKMLLMVVYGREGQFDKALALIDELHAKYPRNFMIEMAKGSVYERMKRWDLAAQTYRQIADKVIIHTNGYDRLRVERVYTELANSQFQGQKFEDATATFALITRSPGSTPNEKASAYLWMARMADTRNDRPEAMRLYRQIEALDCDPSFKSDAQKGLRKPFSSP
jgi:tetratricopeptide (TPR) repeat protein